MDPAGAARRRLVSGRVPDGAAAAADLVLRRGPGGKVRSLPPSVRQAATTDPHRAKLRDALTAWLTWAEAYVAAPSAPPGTRTGWSTASRCRPSLSTGDVVLRADEYVGGTVDWYSFDAASRARRSGHPRSRWRRLRSSRA